MINVKEPRYHDRVVLVGCHHVESGNNVIALTKTRSMNGKYLMTSDEICSYPLGSNGVIECWEVPLDRLLECKVGEL